MAATTWDASARTVIDKINPRPVPEALQTRRQLLEVVPQLLEEFNSWSYTKRARDDALRVTFRNCALMLRSPQTDHPLACRCIRMADRVWDCLVRAKLVKPVSNELQSDLSLIRAKSKELNVPLVFLDQVPVE